VFALCSPNDPYSQPLFRLAESFCTTFSPAQASVNRDYDGGNTTGFASPAGDSIEGPLDLADTLDLRRPNRYPVQVSGDALAARGILDGDILIVDTAMHPSPGSVVVVMTCGETLVSEIESREGVWWLKSADPGRPRLHVGEDTLIWGVARSLIRVKI
jgi:DNA polymerase V